MKSLAIAALALGVLAPAASAKTVGWGHFDGLVVSSDSAHATTVYLPSGSIDTAKIGSGAITAVKIGALAVDTGKLATDSVSTAKILNSAVTTLKIADSAVDTNKVAARAINTTKFAGFGGTPATGSLLCFKANGDVGYCSVNVDTGKTCTCN